MATKPAWQIDDQLDALLVLFRRSIGQRIADGDEALVGAAIGKLDPAHLERRKVEQGDEVFNHFKAAIRAVPGGPFNATVLAIDADRRQEILAAPNAQAKTSSHAVSLSALCALCRHLAAGWPIPFIGNLRRRTRRTRADAP